MDALVQLGSAKPGPAPRLEPRLPVWLRKPANRFSEVHDLKARFRAHGLHTVCESARCPNMHECFSRGAATFMLMGDHCTRGCRFCSVPKSKHPGELDVNEPSNVAKTAASMGLRYVVLTSVNRDDLPDGGSAHFARTVEAVRAELPNAQVEVLTPDFNGDLDAVARVLDAGPDVFNHNVETVPRLYKRVRPQAGYEQSLQVLCFAKSHRPEVQTKSGAMLGLGETETEVHELLGDLRASDVDAVTLGQYLRPTRRNLPVEELVTPERFDAYRDFGLSLGFRYVFSGPFVRSSYMADHVH